MGEQIITLLRTADASTTVTTAPLHSTTQTSASRAPLSSHSILCLLTHCRINSPIHLQLTLARTYSVSLHRSCR